MRRRSDAEVGKTADRLILIGSMLLAVAVLVALYGMKHRCERSGGRFLLGFPFYECVRIL